MQKVVGVKFKKSGKVYHFNPRNDESFVVGDKVIVETANGNEFGFVSDAALFVVEKSGEEPLKNIIRKATEKDISRYESNLKKAEDALALINNKVEKFKLQMKIVEVQFAFDGGKAIVSFTAENRVDFRDLLKELATALKVRIELRQIGNRDEVKAIGGIGPCGEVCCCANHLKEFEHVTVKMAKNQSLSLNPTKISGLCGRLMCCLAYENDTYAEIISRMPKVNSEVITPEGKAVVMCNNILKEIVTVKLFGKDESFTIKDFPLSDLKFKQFKNNDSQKSDDKKED